MRGKNYPDPYAELLDAFNKGNVQYVVIGMTGINYYAKKAEATFTTQDYDIFIKPSIDNVKKSITILKRLGYDINTSEGEMKDAEVKNITQFKRTTIATNPYGITFELILEISGYKFTEIYKDAKIFIIQNIPIRVGKLTKLLRAKKLAGREKDKAFLRRFRNVK